MAEKELLKEIELISQVQTTLTKTLQQTRDQMEACKEAKHRLEMDWSDKYTAQGLGEFDVKICKICAAKTFNAIRFEGNLN